MAISYERYVAVCQPLKVNSSKRKKFFVLEVDFSVVDIEISVDTISNITSDYFLLVYFMFDFTSIFHLFQNRYRRINLR